MTVRIELATPDRLNRSVVVIERCRVAAVLAEEVGEHVKNHQGSPEDHEFHLYRLSVRVA